MQEILESIALFYNNRFLSNTEVSPNQSTKQTNLLMSNKLNLSAIEKYSKNYAAKLCDTFFSSNQMISGKQILTLSSVQQVNLLTIKSLYDKWQAETQRLRSPYFDFNSEEAQQALKIFMNTVSQFISVKRENFEPLLVDSVGGNIGIIIRTTDVL